MRNGRRLHTYCGAGFACSPTPFCPTCYVIEHPIGTLGQSKHFSLSWRDGFVSLGGIGAFRGKKKMMGLCLSKSFCKIQTESDVFLPKEPVFVKHVLVVLGVRGQFECSHPN